MNIALTPVRLLERAVTLFGRRTAVVCQGRRWTYSDFGERVNRLANSMVQLGIQPGDRVAFLGYNSHQLLECYYGVPKMGGVLLPLNIRLIAQDFEYICNDGEPKLLFIEPELLDRIEPIVSRIPSVKGFYLLEPMADPPEWVTGFYEDLITGSSSESSWTSFNYPFNEDDMAELFYTSGTTGPPKGVMLTHRNLYLHALCAMATMPVAETDVQLHLIPLFHVNGWGTPHYLTAKGGTHVMINKFDPAKVLALIQQEKVTRFFIVPVMVTALLDYPQFSSYDVSSVKEILIGGAPPPTGMCARTEEAFGCVVHGGFGMSETCPLIALPELPPDLDGETFRRRAHETWGFPLVGVEYKVVDRMGKELPWDGKAVGELLVRGDMVMKGYLNKPDQTEKALQDGWYHTGDLVSMGPDGSLYIRDRIKDIIISGGENISSLEIEQVLYSHPEILECAVIAKKDPNWGEIPKAIVVLQPGSKLSERDIVNFTRERLAHFKALREATILQELPKGGTGKILKTELRRIYGE
ncbi:MAG: long-chain-fatty-acid--CoA ligase [Deltaproteobacteria bacterium]|nr:long-chain-fatty-acid--CoA ligase [Deltaproteobacteria bacterium]